MRQAGRYLPEYRKLRERHAMLDLAKQPDLATQVTLMPVRRFPLDAAILFSDIMVPAWGLGVPFRIEEPATMVAALNRALHDALARDPAVVVFGEDIEDPKGGVFGFTRGLSTQFPGRVHNSPLAEATIVGVAAGLAAAGLRPVVELQFIDFAASAFNQLLNQVATLRWRSNGQWT